MRSEIITTFPKQRETPDKGLISIVYEIDSIKTWVESKNRDFTEK